LATDPTRARTGSPDEDLLIDIDLAILGAPASEYATYCAAIRKEYAAIPEPQFREGRQRVLRHILSQPIFATREFLPLEDAARRNISDELARLGRATHS
jgi:predicted metal-dependent HD superfamily phosphohydrolase